MLATYDYIAFQQSFYQIQVVVISTRFIKLIFPTFPSPPSSSFLIAFIRFGGLEAISKMQDSQLPLTLLPQRLTLTLTLEVAR